MILRPEPRLISPPWGGQRIAHRYAKGESGMVIGESWEASAESLVGGVPLKNYLDFTLLIKLIDVAGPISVQVHPNDSQAAQLSDQACGKAESWYILEAAPDAQVAWGLKHALSEEALKTRALSGEIEQDLRWVPVQAGQIIDVPPGTIHTIGGGILLYEVQQPSDLTYRLYDWGRPRPLHLKEALRVAHREPGLFEARQVVGTGRKAVTRQAHFYLDRLQVLQGHPIEIQVDVPEAWTVVEGALHIAEETVSGGETVVLGPGAYPVAGEGVGLIAWAPRHAF